jgi:DNA-binding Lrp family transcriptional regulator
MRDKPDFLDVKILEGLGKYGPRNIVEVARKLGIPRGTVLSRIKRMSSLFYLRMSANIYHTNLGLKKGVVFAEATPGFEELLFNCMQANEFYIYLSRCYGRFEGCLGVYVIPNGKETSFNQFVQEMEKLGVARKIEVYWSTRFHTVNRTSKWFDSQSQTWVFPWDEWIDEIQTERTELPSTLVDPKDFPMKVDEIDLFIMKEVEKDATIRLTDIAKKLHVSLPRVKYHYERHVIGLGLIECFQIFVFPFDRDESDMFYFRFEFSDGEKMAKFSLALLDKPFVNAVGKVLGKNAILANLYLPKLEFRRFIDSLSKLIRSGFLQGYDYIIQDLRNVPKTWSRETIPFEFFKDGAWVYDHQKHIKNLRDMVKENILLSKCDGPNMVAKSLHTS